MTNTPIPPSPPAPPVPAAVPPAPPAAPKAKEAPVSAESLLRSLQRETLRPAEPAAPAAPEKDPRRALPNGTVVGEYTITSKLGQGGFGITYRARHNTRGTGVVVKEHMPKGMAVREAAGDFITFPSPEQEALFTETMREFIQEVTVMMGLEHPGIVPILKAFEANGTAYYVMPYVFGRPLELSEVGTLDPVLRAREARGIKRMLLSLLGTLEYMGQHNVVHRDIKPENIIVTPEGHPVLLDFGSARQLVEGKVYTNIYTPGFCAPEQSASKTDEEMSARLGPWTDIYALGATFSYIITRMLPPRAEMRAASSPDPYHPLASRRDLRELYGAAFLSSIDRAMALDPRDRWQNAASWRAAIEEGILPTSPQMARRIRLLAAGAGAALTVLGGISLWALKEREQAMEVYGSSLRLSEGILYDFNEELIDIPGSTALQQQLSEQLRSFLDRMEQLPMGNDEKLQRALAAAWLNFGSLSMSQGKLEEATAALRRATDSVEWLVARYPEETRYRYELARTWLLRAEVARRRNLNAQARALVNDAHRVLLELCEEAPQNPDYRCALGEAISDRVNIARIDGNAELRKESVEKLVALYRDLTSRYPRHDQARLGLAYALQESGKLAMEEADFTNATALLSEAHSVFTELTGQQPYRMSFKKGLALSFFELGNLNSSMSLAAEKKSSASAYDERALVAYGRHISMVRELEALDPHNAEYPFLQCRVIAFMVDTLLRVGRPNLAVSYCNALRLKSEQLLNTAPDNVDYAMLHAGAWRGLALAHGTNAENYAKAAREFASYREEIALRLRHAPENTSLIRAHMDALAESAELAVKMGQQGQARLWLEEADASLNELLQREPGNTLLLNRREKLRRSLQSLEEGKS